MWKDLVKEMAVDALSIGIGVALIIACTVFPVYLIYRIDTDRRAPSYATPASVVSVDGGDTVFETSDGNLWAAASDGFSVGDSVMLLMYDNGTSSVFDDEIRQVIPAV